MTETRSPYTLSIDAFAQYSEDWSKETKSYLSLSKFSINYLINTYANLQDNILTEEDDLSILKVVALKREYDGASKFIYWSIANDNFDRNSHGMRPEIFEALQKLHEHQRNISPENRWGIGIPDNKAFRVWVEGKKTGIDIESPNWDWPSLADFADEYLHLMRELDLVQRADLRSLVNSTICFDKAIDLMAFATRVLEKAASRKIDDPVDLLALALEKFGFQSSKTKQNRKELKKDIDMKLGD